MVLLRKNEFAQVLDQTIKGLNVKALMLEIDFVSELAGVSDPETKRKIIGRVFIEVLMMSLI
jgi:GMP synthase (glutamine-hydrolysing)